MAEKTGVRLFSIEAAAKEFGLDMLKYEDCARWVARQLHPDGAFCPKCSTPLNKGRLESFYLLKKVQCSSCSFQFTAKTGTAINSSKLEVREILLLAVFTHLGAPAGRIAAQLGIHVDTVTNWQAHFQAQREISGPNQIPEADA